MRDQLLSAWRSLRRAPGFALASILTLAVGIGANTVLFSVADAVLFNPLGFRDEARLVIAGEDAIEPRSEISYQQLRDWRARARGFDRIEAIVSSNFAFKIAGPDPIPIEYRAVSAGFFDLLGVRPALGRTFTPDDDRRSAARVVVISHGFWQRQFGGDARIIDRTIVLDDVGLNAGRSTAFTIVGVMPPGFRYPVGADLWTPLVPALASITGPGLPDFVESRDGNILFALGRLKSGFDVNRAREDLDRVNDELAAIVPAKNRVTTRVAPLLDDMVGSARNSLWALLGAAGLLLLVAAANVAGLLLVRTAVRRREFAIRAALGATRGALSRQVFSESVVLVAAATAAAIVVAKVALPLALELVPGDIPRIDESAVNVRVLTFTAFAGLLTTLLCWVGPAFSVGGFGIGLLLQSAGRSFTSGGFRRTARVALVAGEIAIAVVILTCAGLLLRSVSRLSDVAPGFDARNLLTAYVDRPARYEGSVENVRRFSDDAIATFLKQPTVTAAAGVGPRGLGSPYELEGQGAQDAEKNPMATVSVVTPTYFSTMATPLVQGRSFDDRDGARGPFVTIVNQTFAKLAWPGVSPIGKRLKFWGHEDDWRTVVGLAPDVRFQNLALVPPVLYVPDRQIQIPVHAFMVRTGVPTTSAVGSLRQWLRDINPAGFHAVGIVEDEMADARRPWQSNLALFACFAGLTVLLAVVGPYALISSTVVEQSREIGVRIALGATAGRIVRDVLSRGAGVVVAGVIVGIAASVATTRLIQSLLFEVSALDTLTLAAAPVILLGVALVACLVPARRASRVDPMVNLRAE